jgi:hypothetical protein
MFAYTQISRKAQHYICMALSALIVASTFTLSGYAAQATASQDGYSVTITQIL